MKEFDADIGKEGNVTCVALPFDAREALDMPKGAMLVRGEANGCAYRTRLISLGGGRQIMPIDKALRAALGMRSETMHVYFTMEADVADAPCEDYRMPECAMDALTAIVTRRSIRKYHPGGIGAETVDALIGAAFCAPSAKNKRPWHFVVLRDRKMLLEIAETGRDSGLVKEAGVCIVICADRNVQGISELLHADCAAATQNMLLCAHALGFGAVWCGVVHGSELYKKLSGALGLPAKMEPFALVAVGLPAEAKEPTPRFQRGKIHENSW